MPDRAQGPVVAIVVAAGSSTRMDGMDKVFATLAGRPLIAWTLAAFKKCDDVEGIVIVAAPDRIDRMRAFVHEWRIAKVDAVVPGGATRQDSVRAGIEAAPTAAIVAVHDAARPLVTAQIISAGVVLAREAGAAVCAVRSRDTVKQADDAAVITSTLDRDSVWLAQTPQVFDRELLLEAHRRAEATATDDAALVEALGHEVRLYEGYAWNIKVTTPEDLIAAEAVLHDRLSR